MPVQAPTREQPFYMVIPTHRPNKSPYTTRWGYGGRILDLTPRSLKGVDDFEGRDGDDTYDSDGR